MALFGRRWRDGESVEVGASVVRLSVNPRARRVSLRIDRVRREAIAIAPTARRLAEAVAFARKREAWIGARLADLPKVTVLRMEDAVSLFGREVRLRPDGRRPRLKEDLLTGCGTGEVDLQLVGRAIKAEARRIFSQRIAHYCAGLAVPAPRLLITDARSRWGSCAPARPGRPAVIRLSWRLALAPFEVADYVAAHECAHLIEANHGPEFWRLVRDLIGDERPWRSWLRAHGASLHALA